MQRRVSMNNGVAGSVERSFGFEQSREPQGNSVEDLAWSRVGGRRVKSADDFRQDRLTVTEEDLLLSGEIPEEGSFAHARPVGDLLRRDVGEAVSFEEFERRCAKSLGGVGRPSRHSRIVGVMSVPAIDTLK